MMQNEDGSLERPSAVAEKLSLHTLLIRSARVGVTLQCADGSFPAGHNGPHNDPETPTRNTAHWLIVLLFAARQTGERVFWEAAKRAADYLMLPRLRPYGFSYYCRHTPGKDRCNGLMGPAFVIESLVEGGVHLQRKEMLSLAAHLVDMHPFDKPAALWEVCEITGEILGLDPTLNHQIWFASAISSLNAAGFPNGSGDVASFLVQLDRTMALHASGCIVHQAQTLSGVWQLRRLLKSVLRYSTPTESKREVAYHLFNLYPLAILRRNIPGASFWTSSKLRDAIGFARSASYWRRATDPQFVQPYIPAGFPFAFGELAFVEQVFGPNDLSEQARLLKVQYAMVFDPVTGLTKKGTIDPVTQAARVYEMTRLDDVEFELPEWE